jgi:glycosyltransferase involved in cell wall biosynthesis
VGGIVDQIDDGREGILLADPTDLDAFAGALHRVLSEPELARRFGAAARERVRRDFLGIRLLADYAELVEELAPGSPAGAVV